jgi:two-component sensor histidine kinase
MKASKTEEVETLADVSTKRTLQEAARVTEVLGKLLHDLSNDVHIIESLASLAYSNAKDPETRADLKEIRTRADSAVALLTALKRIL